MSQETTSPHDDQPHRPGRFEALMLTWLLGGYTMLGPFSISTYMPFFPEVAASLEATTVEIQLSLSVYLASFGFMMLFHGPLSDSYGRRPVILLGLLTYTLASLGAAFATSIEALLVFRALQGLSVGAGSVVGRAIIRDRLEGHRAQRLLSQVTMIFALAPAFAPVIGGWLHNSFPWQSVFIFLGLFGLIQLIASYTYLPETHPKEKRQPMHPVALGKRYGTVARSRNFWLLSLSVSSNFAGFFLYIASAPLFILDYLDLEADQFGWFFIPAMSGVILGSYLSGRVSKRLGAQATIRYGYITMFVAATLNLAYNLLLPPLIPWIILPVVLYTTGMALAMPGITILTLDLFQSMRGMVSSLQGFIQTMFLTFVSGVAAPLLSGTGINLALGTSGFLCLGFAAWWLYARQVDS
ncbi:multidrug effflux MFS transporter [Halovibrio sp. HP20-50]|jgi:MFS transporter, DHA1 family, multidrug resistance protein|uniref:multidrug effflux MFS transporter n=1 Tax=Halovibrio sp. HP20-59 TaxID=3080275 RepID=UPI00294B7EF8|nr:multidrug effflux MFS transporter [Halovibrio sp. HP20-59]MEA2118788.1 multidrug effflux MFS transporter [Halovibrio sp. HP20-59]